MKGFIRGSTLQSIVDKIREKLGTETTYKPSEISNGIEEVHSHGHDEGFAIGYDNGLYEGNENALKSVIEGTATEITSDTVTAAADNAFYSFSTLKSITLPNATSVGAYAFYGCNLATINLPNVTTAAEYAFTQAIVYNSVVDLSALTTADQYCFSNNMWGAVSLPNLRYVNGSMTFSRCSRLADIELPSLERAGTMLSSGTPKGGYTFNSCSYLKSISLPALTTADLDCMFYYCSQLVTVSMPNLQLSGTTSTANAGTFMGCNRLTNVTIGKESVGQHLYIGNSSLLTDDSIQNIIDALKDMTGANSKTLTLHSTVLAKLTEEQLATIEAKNWVAA